MSNLIRGNQLLPSGKLDDAIVKSIEENLQKMLYKVPLLLSPQPEGGFTVTSPLLPELLTEGDTVEEAMANVQDALAAVVEIYQDLGRALPLNLCVADANHSLWLETLVVSP